MPARLAQIKSRLSALNQSGGRPIFSYWGLSCFAVILLSAIVFNICLAGTAVWDDKWILSGDAIGGGNLLNALNDKFNFAYYRPFTSLSYATDLLLFGRDPFYFHVVNLALHIFGGLLTIWVAFLLTKRRLVASLAGLFFAVQPAQVGATAWIGGRTDALSCICILAFVGGLVRWYDGKKTWWLILSLAAFFSAAMVKEQNLALYLLVPISAWMLGNRKRNELSVLSALFLIPTCAFLGLWFLHYPQPYTPEKVGLITQFGHFLTTIVHYTALMLIPTGYGFDSFSLANYLSPAWSVIGAVLLLIYIWGLWKVSSRDRMLGFAGIAAVVAFLPISNLIPLPSLPVAPYRVAVAGIFVAILLSSWTVEGLSKRRHFVGILPLLCLAWCTAIAPWAAAQWRSELDLFSAVHHYDPHGVLGEMYYFNVELDAGHPQEAYDATHQVLSWLLSPGWDGNYSSIPDLLKRPDVHQRVTQIDMVHQSGTSADAPATAELTVATLLNDDAVALSQLSRDSEGLEAARAALAINPHNANVLAYLGDSEVARNPKGALEFYQRSVSEEPNKFENIRRLAKTQAALGQFTEAAKNFQKAAELRPWDGSNWIDAANVFEALGNLPRAIYALRQAENGLLPDAAAVKQRRIELTAKYWKSVRSTSRG